MNRPWRKDGIALPLWESEARAEEKKDLNRSYDPPHSKARHVLTEMTCFFFSLKYPNIRVFTRLTNLCFLLLNI